MTPLTDKDPFPFGVHKGQPMEKVPARYLDWLIDQPWISRWPAIKEDGVDYEIKRRTREYAQGLNTKHVIASDGKTGLQPQSESGAIKNLKHRQELIMSGKRNKRSVWTINTQPCGEAHFATFPPDLVKPCLRAGTSEWGCCPTCGSPWERIVEKQMGERHESENQTIGSGRGKSGDQGKHTEPTQITMLGWQPTCKCPKHEPVSCIVLDPFAGAGTTGLVAEEEGRNSILIELNPAYIEITKKRTAQQGLFCKSKKEVS